MRDGTEGYVCCAYYVIRVRRTAAAGFTEILFSSSCLLRAWIYDEDMKDETTREMNLCLVCFFYNVLQTTFASYPIISRCLYATAYRQKVNNNPFFFFSFSFSAVPFISFLGTAVI
jgi:hypothetical protein